MSRSHQISLEDFQEHIITHRLASQAGIHTSNKVLLVDVNLTSGHISYAVQERGKADLLTTSLAVAVEEYNSR